MTKKRAFAIAYCVLFVIPLILLVIFNSLKMPDLYYSFENDLQNTLSANTAALSYGNLSFTDGAAKGRGLNLNDGFYQLITATNFYFQTSSPSRAGLNSTLLIQKIRCFYQEML